MPEALPALAESIAVGIRQRSRFALAVGVGGLGLNATVGQLPDVADSLIATTMMVAGWGGVIWYLVLQQRLRDVLKHQDKTSDSPLQEHSWPFLAGVTISQVILATFLAVTHDPLMVGLLCILTSASLVGAIRSFRTESTAAKVYLLKSSIYGLAALLGCLAAIQDRDNADALVNNLAEYQHRHGAYPEKLDGLVPELLPEIPRPGMGHFSYLRQEKSYWLSYCPSLAGPCSYRPEEAAWNCSAG